MGLTTLIFTFITALIHVIFFAAESFFWLKPAISGRILEKIDFSVAISSVEKAQAFQVVFFNQGFYNLFIAIAGFAGILLFRAGKTQAGTALAAYAYLSALFAGIILALSAGLILGGLVQGLPPLIALLGFLLTLKNKA